MSDAVDPMAQVELWLHDFMNQTGKRWEKPSHSTCLNVCRYMFRAEAGLPDLERILQRLHAEKVKPRAYRWLVIDIWNAFEDLKHERTAAIEANRK